MLSSVLVLLSALAGLTLADTFNLYAYGDGIGGLPLHYADGAAIISKKAPANATNSDVVSFTTSDGQLVGNPNTTSSDPPFSNTVLFIPGPDSSSDEVGFLNASATAPDDEVTSKFVWYGHFLLVENDAGELTSLFSVQKSSDDDEEYALLWNTTDSDSSSGEFISVSMRSVAPSTD
ncbi:hypothetical protein BJY01DRAFT_249236 [Aspergillus pseudoustus]|uniref:Uncharacterized protein n=1 Tax=Aspergillus pseudoustus TaxID=1810923 RepID=A0ABR4JQ92_9EURO